MSRVFISFLGLGSHTPVDGYGYIKVNYQLGGHQYPTHFSQAAVLAYHDWRSFDRIVLLETKESHARHHHLLFNDPLLTGLSADDERVRTPDFLDADTQDETSFWSWFGHLLQAIDEGDEVIFDFTHGFRSVPIIFATAISFIERARPFHLLHAYYGYVPHKSTDGTIVDLSPFFAINRWANALSALVDSADASQLAKLVDRPESAAFPSLRGAELADALNGLTTAMKDVHVNQIAERAQTAMQVVQAKKGEADTEAEHLLLDLVANKFTRLSEHVGSGKYDQPYFKAQTTLAGLLIDHGMHMQAYTVMRETIASIGMLGVATEHLDRDRSSGKSRKKRGYYAEIFASMANFPRSKWKWEAERAAQSDEAMEPFKQMLPLWDTLAKAGLTDRLHRLANSIATIRNGLDHGWTAKQTPDHDIAKSARAHVAELTDLLDAIGKLDLYRH